MRIDPKKIALAASISLAMALTSCGGSKPPVAESSAPATALSATPSVGPPPSRDAGDIMAIECEEKYKDDFCGVGTGIADSPDAAEELAEADARGKLATKISTEISRDFERDRVVDLNKKTHQAAFSILEEHLKKMQISNTHIRDARTVYDEQKGLYTKYRSISANKSEVFKKVADDISSTLQTLQDTEDAREFSGKVRDYFGKKK